MTLLDLDEVYSSLCLKLFYGESCIFAQNKNSSSISLSLSLSLTLLLSLFVCVCVCVFVYSAKWQCQQTFSLDG